MQYFALLTPLLACAWTATARPTSTEDELAPRSYPSGGTTCYSQCPPATVNGAPLRGNFDNQDEYYYDGTPYHGCYYYNDDFTSFYECDYAQDGSYLGSEGNSGAQDPACPARAAPAGCGAENPNPGTAFKRSVTPRPLTKAEKVIRARQYKPTKGKN
ncbi:hypothetical protein IAR55_007188 [Kwoniella newhampshirensis]|uniref:Uncharacterized protein n=1 Tax=Kwoniella newhampshirensis TaxID=1651941 RepID=A0AAW0YWF2_9TREE